MKSRALSEAAIRAAKADPNKILKLVDGAGLTLVVRSGGRRVWELRVQRGGKDTTEMLGEHPAMSLKAARDKAEARRVELRSGSTVVSNKTLGEVLELWFANRRAALKPSYAADAYRRLDRNVKDEMKRKPIAAVRTTDVIAICNVVADRSAHEQARRVRALLAQVFDFALLHEWIETNPAPKAVLKALPARGKVKHHPAVPVDQLPAVMRAINAYPSIIVRAALLFTILTAARTNEVLAATWNEFDLKAATWTVPAERMKAGREHVVPLSAQAVAITKSLPRISDTFVFPTYRGDDRPLSNMAMLSALKSLGVDATVHGTARSTFSTWANDTRAAEPDIIEAALAHVVPGVRGAYDRGTRLESRRQLMQDWADFSFATNHEEEQQ